MTPNMSLLVACLLVSTLVVSCGGSDTVANTTAISLDQRTSMMDADLKGKSSLGNGSASNAADSPGDMTFRRVASFAVCAQIGSSCDSEEPTAAEIVAASIDGKTLIYTNSPRREVEFVDITDPARPLPIGALAMDGEPTSVTVRGRHALVAVNTSEDRAHPNGRLAIVDIEAQVIVASLVLPGQSDSIAVSGNGRFVAVVIENERDEELDTGAPPQLPAGGLVIVDAAGKPADWKMRSVDLRNLPGARFAEDPEPEYVSINGRDIAVVTLQENNHIVLVNLVDGKIIDHSSARTVNLERVDATDNAMQQRFGFEGIAESDGELVVTFQRAWGAEANPRLGIYNLASNTWRFVFYHLDAAESPNGGWVGLSDLSALGSGRFLVVERDNQGGPDARIKRLYGIDLSGVADGSVVGKTLVRDLLPALRAPGGAIPEKIEGLAVLGSGEVLVVNDNDGVNDNSGETQFLRLGRLVD